MEKQQKFWRTLNPEVKKVSAADKVNWWIIDTMWVVELFRYFFAHQLVQGSQLTNRAKISLVEIPNFKVIKFLYQCNKKYFLNLEFFLSSIYVREIFNLAFFTCRHLKVFYYNLREKSSYKCPLVYAKLNVFAWLLQIKVGWVRQHKVRLLNNRSCSVWPGRTGVFRLLNPLASFPAQGLTSVRIMLLKPGS